MADYRNLLINVEPLEAGKFYKLYTDKNGTTLLLPKDRDDILELDVEQLKLDVQELSKANDSQIITISNGGGVSPANGLKSIVVRNEAIIPLSELSAHAVVVDYCLYKNKDIECGKLTIIDGEQLLIEEDRTHPSSLLPVIFTATKDNDMLNLKLNIQAGGIYTFKYKTLIF